MKEIVYAFIAIIIVWFVLGIIGVVAYNTFVLFMSIQDLFKYMMILIGFTIGILIFISITRGR